jgi:hypothetical protein
MVFQSPGYAKIATNLILLPSTTGTVLQTNTRVLALNEVARRKFAWYWFVIRLGSGWICMEWVHAIKRKAESE